MAMLQIGMDLITTEGIKIVALNRRDGKSFDVIYNINGKPEKKVITPTLKGSLNLPKKNGVCRRTYMALRKTLIDEGQQIFDIGKTMFIASDGLMSVSLASNGLSLCFKYGRDFEYTTAPCKHQKTTTALFNKCCKLISGNNYKE